MKKLRCDKPYNQDEARKKRGLPRRKRDDSRTTAYELTIRIPDEYSIYFDGKKKLTRVVFALNRKDDLKEQIEAFEEEKNAELEHKLEERGWIRDSSSTSPKGACITTVSEYFARYIEIRSTGSITKETVSNERLYLKYVDASIGDMPVSKLTAKHIEDCLLRVPELSEQWAKERRAAQEENRTTKKWVKKHGKSLKPLSPIRVAGPDMQSKILKFIREALNYAVEKGDLNKNVAKAKFLTRVFKKSKPLIDPLMTDDASKLLEKIEALPLGYFKVCLLLLLGTGMRPEEVLAIRVGNIIFDADEAMINITSVISNDGKAIRDYPKSDASRRSVPIDAYTSSIAKQWIEYKSNELKNMGFNPSMKMILCSPEIQPRTYRAFLKEWHDFLDNSGFERIRPYALRHTFATLNLANGENIKTVSVLMGHASSGYTLDLYAGYVPNTGIGIGSRYMKFLRDAI